MAAIAGRLAEAADVKAVGGASVHTDEGARCPWAQASAVPLALGLS